jgi:4-amino-4-deoxy-L-arabinose transferase-like glycosyltransferase
MYYTYKYVYKYLLFLSFVILLLIIFVINYNESLSKYHKLISIEEYEKILETGDLVLFQWDIEYLLDIKII